MIGNGSLKTKPASIPLYRILEHRTLTREEENELGALSLAGDLKARDLLVEHSQRLVMDIAVRLWRTNPMLELYDLYSEGNLGLIKAAERFDPTKGSGFATYAKYWIFESMESFTKQRSGSIRLPDNRAEDIISMRKLLREHPAMGVYEISQRMKLSEATVRVLLPFMRTTLSLDSKTDDGCGECPPQCDSLCQVDVDFDHGLILEELHGILKQLPERSREVLMHRYGVFGTKKATLEELAGKYGLSKQRVGQIERKALCECRRLARI